MRKRWVVVLLLLAIISSNCNRDKKNAETIKLTDKVYSLNYKKIKEVKIDTLSGASFKRISSERYIYTSFASQDYDKGLGIRKYDLDLRTIEEFIIKHGQGPNECINPIVVGGTEDEIMVYDNIPKKYYIYNRDFSSRYTIENRLYESFVEYGFNYFPAKKIAVIASWKIAARNRADYNIYTRRIKGKSFEDRVVFSGHFDGFKINGLLNWGEPYDFTIIDDYIYILELDKYRFLKMDVSGKVIKSLSITNIPDKRFSRREREKWIKEAGLPEGLTFPEKLWPACWMIRINDGLAVGRRENYDTTKEDEWIDADYFDLSLNFRGKIKVPGFVIWRDPKFGQHAAENRFLFRANHLFIVERRDRGDDEDYYLTKWKVN